VTHRVGLVRYSREVHAWVLSLPGCVAAAAKEADLDASLRLAIAEHCGWLRANGEEAPTATGWQVVERIDGESLGATGGEFCFEDYRRGLAPEEFERGMRLLAHARSELAGATESLPEEVLDWAPPREAFGQFDEWAPEVRTIRDVVRHVLELEVYYRSGLRDGPAAGIFERVGSPWDEHARTADVLRAMDEESLSRSYWPVRPGRTVPEEWTARKVLARLISHERVHTAEIWQRRSWVLLGTPG
jgi:hypothetical protein